MNSTQALEQWLSSQDRRLAKLACDLHDGPCQALIATLYHLDEFRLQHAAHSEGNWRNFDQALNLLEGALYGLRTLMSELRPVEITGVGLIDALKGMIHEYATHHGLLVTLHHNLAGVELPALLKTAVLRVVQEGLSNVRRHSRTKQASVEVVQEEQSLRVEIEDRGTGFDVAKVGRDRLGIERMRTWVALLGGYLNVTSRGGGGTRVVADIPLARTQPEDASPVAGAILPCKGFPLIDSG